MRQFIALLLMNVKTNSIIHNGDLQDALIRAEQDFHLVSLGMFTGIGERFLNDS